jgi:hypothetical protein
MTLRKGVVGQTGGETLARADRQLSQRDPGDSGYVQRQPEEDRKNQMAGAGPGPSPAPVTPAIVVAGSHYWEY